MVQRHVRGHACNPGTPKIGAALRLLEHMNASPKSGVNESWVGLGTRSTAPIPCACLPQMGALTLLI